MLYDSFIGVATGSLLALSALFFRVGWTLWFYEPTMEDRERWWHKEQDRRAVKFLRTGKL